MAAARIGILILMAGLTTAPSVRLLADDNASADSPTATQISPAQTQGSQSVMTQPAARDTFTPLAVDNSSADNSPARSIRTLDVSVYTGSAQRPGLLADGSATAPQPANLGPQPELLPAPWQANGPTVASPGEPDNSTAQATLDPSAGPPPPVATDQPADNDEPARQHPILDGFRRQFGPEPNGNWGNEPVHFDTFLGFLDDRAAQNTGVFGGFRLGWDYDTYWGVETRLAFTSLQEDTGPVVVWDESLLYYPWADSRVRPYFTLGLGISEFKIVDPGDDLHHRQNLVDMPFGIGFKYRLHEWLVLRFDILDNLAFGSGGLGTMNNFSFTTGFEYRFGGAHFSYWPWDPAPAR